MSHINGRDGRFEPEDVFGPELLHLDFLQQVGVLSCFCFYHLANLWVFVFNPTAVCASVSLMKPRSSCNIIVVLSHAPGDGLVAYR